MPPPTARRRWTVVLAVQLAAALLAAAADAGSAADAGELIWLGEAGGQTEGRWTTDPSVRPWQDADGNPVVLEPLPAATPLPRPVTLAAVADQAVDEGEPLALRLHADPGEPASPLRWRLLGQPPAGLRLDRHSALRWTPREAQGPGRHQVAVRVEDAGDPDRHDQRSFTVTVGEVNRPPALRGPARASVAERKPLKLAFAASDPDRPGARLEYGLTGDAPAGARLDPRTGVLRWTPGHGQGPGEYTVVVWVLDDGTPRLADTRTVTITVADRAARQPAGTAAEPVAAPAQTCAARSWTADSRPRSPRVKRR